jgi:hypothetical protein
MLVRLGMTPGKRGISSGLARKQAADQRAAALVPIIRELRAAGIVTLRLIAHALNVRQIPTAQGGNWHRTSVGRLLHRLERLELPSRTSNRFEIPRQSLR